VKKMSEMTGEALIAAMMPRVGAGGGTALRWESQSRLDEQAFDRSWMASPSRQEAFRLTWQRDLMLSRARFVARLQEVK